MSTASNPNTPCKTRHPSRIAALFLVLIGSLFLLRNLGVLELPWAELREFARVAWPLIPLAVGLSWLLRRR